MESREKETRRRLRVLEHTEEIAFVAGDERPGIVGRLRPVAAGLWIDQTLHFGSRPRSHLRILPKNRI